MRTVIVTGGSSGLGKLIIEHLETSYTMQQFIHDWSRETDVDLRDSGSVEAAALSTPDKVDILINCAGINFIDWIGGITDETWYKVLDTNASGIFFTTRALLSRLRGGTILNIVSNASHVPMTCSLAYNASKGAAEIMTRQMARELKKTHDITVFGISPNKLKGTGMSEYIDQRVCELRGWTKEQAREYQLASLPAGEETDPVQLAAFIGFLLSRKERHKYLNGCIIPYGA